MNQNNIMFASFISLNFITKNVYRKYKKFMNYKLPNWSKVAQILDSVL